MTARSTCRTEEKLCCVWLNVKTDSILSLTDVCARARACWAGAPIVIMSDQ